MFPRNTQQPRDGGEGVCGWTPGSTLEPDDWLQLPYQQLVAHDLSRTVSDLKMGGQSKEEEDRTARCHSGSHTHPSPEGLSSV